MFRFYALLLLGAFFIFCVAMFISSLFREKKRHQRIQSAFEREYAARNRDNAPEVKELVDLYMNMVAKHGPDSEEAKAFRFGTDSTLIKRLHGSDELLSSFQEQADAIDEICRRISKRRARRRSNRGD